MAYIGKTPSQAVRSRYFYTAAGGETSLSGADDNGDTLIFADGNYVDVYLNGVLLVAGSDYNVNTVNTIAGLTALTASDIVEIVVYDTFSVFGGVFQGDLSADTITTNSINLSTTTTVSSVLDEDTMTSDSATALATQQSIKAYVDSQIGSNNELSEILTNGNTTSGNDISFGDNDKAVFGAGSDLQIYHDGLHSRIADAGTGDLKIGTSGGAVRITANGVTDDMIVANQGGSVILSHSGSTKLATTATGVSVTGDAAFADNGKAIFGAGNDLQIYHDGGQSVIRDYGYGHLRIQAGDLRLENADGTATYLAADNGAALYAYHDGNVKLTTTATGVDVTGTVTADGVESTCAAGDANQALLAYHPTSTSARTIAKFQSNVGGTQQDKVVIKCDGSILATKGSAGTLATFTDGVNSNFVVETASLLTTIGNGGGSAALALKANNTEAMRINSSGNVGIGTTSIPTGKLAVEGGIYLSGSSNFLRFGADSSTPTGVAIHRPAANVLGFVTASSERMRIDSSGNVGIGITTPDAEPRLHVRKGDAGGVDSATNSVLTIENSTTAILQFLTPNNANQQIRFGDPQDTGAGFIQYNHTDNAIQFGTNGPEKMRITSGGKVLLNTTSTSYGGQLTARQTDGVSVAAIAAVNTATSGTRRLIDFFTGTSTTRKGSIESNGSTTSFNETSDYRLKENVNYDWDATTRLKQLKPAQFNFISTPDETRDGFLAHEVEEVSPQSITGTKDAMIDEEYEVTPAVLDEDGNEVTPAVMGTQSVPDYQGIDQSKLVPLLVKTIQELEARITALETAE